MSKVISNSSPIISLSMIGHLSLMIELFSEVYLPAEVYREIVESESIREHGKHELQEAVEQGRFHVYQVQNEALVSKLYGKLHRGELEVIIGAKELGLEYVIIDEKAARRLADTFLLNSLGTVGHKQKQFRLLHLFFSYCSSEDGLPFGLVVVTQAGRRKLAGAKEPSQRIKRIRETLQWAL